MRRRSLHILPKGYIKTRRFGGCSNHHRKRYIAACSELLDVLESTRADDEAPREHLCPNCNILLRLVDRINRPGGYILMKSPHRPDWYDDA